MILFYIFAILLIIQSLISLKQGFSYLSYFQKFSYKKDFIPRVAIIAPCKGLDASMAEYFKSLFEQDYPNYQITFVVENSLDPALREINKWQALYPKIQTNCAIAGTSDKCGQKVHNLKVAINSLDQNVEAFAFVDSDVCLPKTWLMALIAPLADKTVAATTGYRWFVPTDNRLASLLRSIWNGSIATSLGDHQNNFAWGGSMAILRSTFYKIDVERYWQGTVSDDYGLTQAVKASKQAIKFVPSCLVPSLGGCSFSELLEFTTRQIIITKVYSKALWWLLFISNSMFNLVFFVGLVLGIILFIKDFNFWPLLLVLIIYFLGIWKSVLRIKAIKLVLTDYEKIISQKLFSYYFFSPLVALIFGYNL
ncbi:MAG: glycosyltransferase family 2 protein, partial [Blastocatellia bacterium]|nr:glycosyltransferase family 2 protein [Blastocatellia bacterium]